MNLLRSMTRMLLKPGKVTLCSENHLCRNQLALPVVSTCEVQERTCSLMTSEHTTLQEKSQISNVMLRGYKTLSSHTNLEPLHSSLARNQSVQLLKPSQILSIQASGYKVKRKLRKRCPQCYFEKRKGRWYIECRVKPRHKQMQKMPLYKVFAED